MNASITGANRSTARVLQIGQAHDHGVHARIGQQAEPTDVVPDRAGRQPLQGVSMGGCATTMTVDRADEHDERTGGKANLVHARRQGSGLV